MRVALKPNYFYTPGWNNDIPIILNVSSFSHQAHMDENGNVEYSICLISDGSAYISKEKFSENEYREIGSKIMENGFVDLSKLHFWCFRLK